MKLPTLLICLLLLSTRTTTALEPTPSSSPPGNAYGIEPAQSYPGSLVEELLAGVEEEMAIAVRGAYAEGYKAGRIEGAELWQPKYDAAVERTAQAWRSELASRSTALFAGLISGLIVGIGLTVATCVMAR